MYSRIDQVKSCSLFFLEYQVILRTSSFNCIFFIVKNWKSLCQLHCCFLTFLNLSLCSAELFLRNGWPMKCVKPYVQVGSLSEILTIANLRHTANRIPACTESEFRFCWMNFCCSDNHCTTAPSLLWLVDNSTVVVYQFVIACEMIEIWLFCDWNWNLSILLNYFAIALLVSVIRLKCH